jgi:hypothetical protein
MIKIGSVNLFWKTVDILTFTGVIVDQDKSSHTEVHATNVGNAYSGNNVRVTTTVTNFNHVFVRNESGEERDIELKNPKVAFRNGQTATIICGTDPGAAFTYDIALYNNSLGQLQHNIKLNNELAMMPKNFLGKAAFIVVGCIAILLMIMAIFNFLFGNIGAALLEGVLGGGYIGCLWYLGKTLRDGVSELISRQKFA